MNHELSDDHLEMTPGKPEWLGLWDGGRCEIYGSANGEMLATGDGIEVRMRGGWTSSDSLRALAAYALEVEAVVTNITSKHVVIERARLDDLQECERAYVALRKAAGSVVDEYYDDGSLGCAIDRLAEHFDEVVL